MSGDVSPLFGLSQRQPPSNIQAEQALLGALLANNGAYARVSTFLRPEHFADHIHGRIYQAIQRRIKEGQLADAVTLKAEFEHAGILDEVGGTAYLAQLLTAMVGIINASEYGRAVHDCWLRRQEIEIAEIVYHNAIGDGEQLTGAARLDEAVKLLRMLSESVTPSRGNVMLADAVISYIDSLDDPPSRFETARSTGLAGLDAAIGGGAQAGTLTYFLGMQKHGKTELALQGSETVAFDAMKEWQAAGAGGACPCVLYITFSDMNARRIAARTAARLSGVALAKLRRREIDMTDGVALKFARDKALWLPVEINDTGPATPSHVAERIKDVVRRRPCLLVVVDNYTNLLTKTDGKDQMARQAASIAEGLKEAASESNVPVWLLMHTKQAVGERGNPRPLPGDIPWGTGPFCDAAVGVWRPILFMQKNAPERREYKSDELYQKRLNEWHEGRNAMKGITEIVPLALREDDGGDGGQIAKLRLNPDTRRFEEITGET